MKTFIKLTFILMLIILSTCKTNQPAKKIAQDSIELSGVINISGTDALYPLMKIWTDEFAKDKFNLKFVINKEESGKGITDLLSGNADLAMVSRNLTPEEESNNLFYIVISREGVIPIIIENNPYLEEMLHMGIKRDTLIRLFTCITPVTWGEILNTEYYELINIFIRADLFGAAEVWANYLGKTQKDLVGTLIEGDEGIVEALSEEPMGLAFCNAHYVYNLEKNEIRKGIKVLPIDINNNGIIDKKE